MFGREGKAWIRVLMVMCIIIPVGIMLWSIEWGVIALVLGFIIIGRAMHMLHMMHLEGTLDDQEALHAKANSGRTIYVQLVDEAGVDFPPEIAKAKLREAQQKAGPRETVLGVRHKVL